MSEGESGELRRGYRTLDDPTRLLGISVGVWAALVVGAAVGYGWLLVSPLGWRANVSLVVIGLGAPLGLLALREQTTVSPGRLVLAIVAWRWRGATITALDEGTAVTAGAVRLDEPPPAPAAPLDELSPALPWHEDSGRVA